MTAAGATATAAPATPGRRLRILYVGAQWPGSTCAHRATVLSELGHEVIPLDDTPYHGSSRLVRGLQFRLSAGPGVLRLNQAFLRHAAETRPDLIWVDKGIYIWGRSVRRARELAGHCPVIHYNPDDPFGGYGQGWRVFLKAIPDYDLHLVPRAVNVDEYRVRGACRVERYWFSYDRALHRPIDLTPEDRARLGGPVGFIGLFEPERTASMQALAAAGIPVRVWGPQWNPALNAPNFRVENAGIFGADYPKALCAFDIGLGFLRKRNRDLHTQRTFEIPACGAFLLAERTDEHLSLFDEGREAEFFGSDQELIDKARYYLDHPRERQRIAAAGRERCLRSGYSNHERVAQMLRAAEDLLR